jgi:signal transduction histidine kinase
MDSLDSTILDEVGGFIFVLDRQGRVRRANRRARELICSAGDLAGRSLGALQPASASAGDALRRLEELSCTGRDGESCSMRLACADGKFLDMTWRVIDLPRLPYRILVGEPAAAPAGSAGEAAQVQEERRRIARELHDETGQSLTSVLIGLRVLENANTLSQVQAHVEELRRIVRDALEGVRRMAAGLRPAAVEELGLAAALDQLARECSRTLGIGVEVDAGELEGAGLSVDAEAGLYRIVQEALANVGRHARARLAEVRLRRDGTELRLTVRDDGRGFDTAEGATGRKGQGLQNIRERARSLGGVARFESWRGAGTVVTVTVPLAGAAAAKE